jgi:hypothetical protein
MSLGQSEPHIASLLPALESPDLESTKPAVTAAAPNCVWLPTVALQPGMTVARPVVGNSGVLETMYLAVGSTITTHTIAQMVVKGVECVAVRDDAAPEAASAAAAETAFRQRLAEIFGPQPDAGCRALMDALLLARPML